MKKILILANNDVGLYRFRKDLIQELLKENQVMISLPNGDMVRPLVEMGCHFLDTPVDRRGMNPLRDLKLYREYRRIIKSVQPDLVITYTIKPNIYGGYACRRKNVPYAVNITGLGSAFQKPGKLRDLVIAMYKVALKNANVVFFENTSNRDVFTEEKIVTKEKTHVLNGAGVDLNHFVVQPYPEERDAFRFLFVGRVMQEKGVDELFSTMKTLRAEGYQCELDVVGSYEENYESTIQEYSVEGWLHYHGFQTDPRPFLKDCDCYVLPSWHEGMANTNLEAAASGRPVITSNIPGCREAVEDGISGLLCECRDSESLAEQLRKMMDCSVTEREKMGLNGRKRMELFFDKKLVVDDTIGALNGI